MQIKPDKQIVSFLLSILLQACSTDMSQPGDASHDAGLASADASAAEPSDARVPSSADATSSTWSDAQVPHGSGQKAYVGLFGDGVIGVFDVAARQVVKTIPVSAPDGLVITPDGKKVYVSSTDTGTVQVIGTSDDTLMTSIAVGSKPAGLAITPDGRLLVAAVGGANEAVVIDVGTDTIVRHVPVGQAHASCITADGKLAYVGSQVSTAPAVVVVDLTQDTPARSISVDKSPRMLSCAADRIYFTAVGLDAVEVLDPSTGTLASPIPSGGSPHDVRAGQTNQTELVVSQTAGDLEFIDVASATVTAKVATGKLAHWITLSTDRTLAYVTNEGDDSVSIVDLTQQRVIDTVKVGKAPRKMALQP